MFDLSLPELAVIAVVALLVLGPKRLPGAARTAGALVRRAQRSWSGLRADIERELAADDIKRELKRTGEDLNVDGLRDDLARTRRSIEKDLSPGSDNAGDSDTPPATDATDSSDHGRT